MIKTVDEIQGVDLVAGNGVAIRFMADDGEDCVLHLSDDEAHGLSDMLAIALSRRSGA